MGGTRSRVTSLNGASFCYTTLRSKTGQLESQAQRRIVGQHLVSSGSVSEPVQSSSASDSLWQHQASSSQCDEISVCGYLFDYSDTGDGIILKQRPR